MWEEQLLQQGSIFFNSSFHDISGLPELFDIALQSGVQFPPQKAY